LNFWQIISPYLTFSAFCPAWPLLNRPFIISCFAPQLPGYQLGYWPGCQSIHNERMQENTHDSCHIWKRPVTVNGTDIVNIAHPNQFLDGRVRSKQARQTMNVVEWMPWGSEIPNVKESCVTWRRGRDEDSYQPRDFARGVSSNWRNYNLPLDHLHFGFLLPSESIKNRPSIDKELRKNRRKFDKWSKSEAESTTMSGWNDSNCYDLFTTNFMKWDYLWSVKFLMKGRQVKIIWFTTLHFLNNRRGL
jgi:hypothetical protein